MTHLLTNKVALVAGGSSGLGRAGAIAMAAAGARVVVAARRIDMGNTTVQAFRQAGGEATFIQADLTRASDVEALVARTVATYDRLDCAFNNVGIASGFSYLHEIDEDTYDRIMIANVKTVWLCMKYQIQQMLRQGGGSIVNMSSVFGLIAHPHVPCYSATKHAIIGLTKSAALAYAPENIRVNAVCPTCIGDTPVLEAALQAQPQSANAFISQIPLGRLGMSSEVARAVVWLCSDAASLVTGHSLALDGGQLAG